MNDWTGYSYLSTHLEHRAEGYLLSAQQRAELRRYLLRTLPSSNFNPGEAGHADAIRAAIAQALRDRVLPDVSLAPDAATVDRLYAETVGLGPLEALLVDETVTSITANGPGPLLVERLDHSGVTFVPGFDATQSLLQAMEALAHRAGRSLTPAEPLIDLVWSSPGGATTRAHLNLLGRDAPFLALRRGRREAFRLDDYVAQGRMSGEMAVFLAKAVQAGVSIAVCGMPGSGKTALLETLLHRTTPSQGHIVLIEDDPEINVGDLAHVSAFQVPRPHIGEESPIGFLGLVLASLRMNCRSILVCGEVRGAEAGAIIAVMPSYRAVWLTVHGTSPVDGLERLVAAAQMGGGQPPSPFNGGRQEHLVRRNLAAGLQLLVQMDRLGDDRIGVAGIYWLESLSDGGLGWGLTPVFRVCQQVRDGELHVFWDADPEFHWPDAVANRLAMADLGVRLDKASFESEIDLARGALEGNQPEEATRRLTMLYSQVSGQAERRVVLTLLRQALRAQPARWETLIEGARKIRDQLDLYVQDRDWRQAHRLLEDAERTVESIVALEDLGLDDVRHRIASGLEALASWNRIREQALRLGEASRHWAALNALAGQPWEQLPSRQVKQVVRLQADQLQSLKAMVESRDEEGEPVARAILRTLPASCTDLHHWAHKQLGRRE